MVMARGREPVQQPDALAFADEAIHDDAVSLVCSVLAWIEDLDGTSPASMTAFSTSVAPPSSASRDWFRGCVSPPAACGASPCASPPGFPTPSAWAV
ncbi:hypothetical protein FOA52_009837 [Chlamydomonas sp. UWO 241]|nr:hypothetical protein FOA52_009837 [Chlamydomonas sp. UWO 241]